jgi:hypothetical protein
VAAAPTTLSRPGKVVKTKKKCCKSGPRCKKCPAAMKKLERKGLAERTGKRSYVLSLDVTKKDLKAARRR